MNRSRYRQMGLFLMVLILPSLVAASLGWILLGKEREIEDNQSDKAIEQEITAIGRSVLDQLDNIVKIAPPGTVASSGPLVLVGWADEQGLMLPWEDLKAFHRPSSSEIDPELDRLLAQAKNAEDEKSYVPAANLYFQGAQSAREDSQRASALLGQARTLLLSGAQSKGRDIYLDELLNYPWSVVDDLGVPFACWAATALVGLHTAEGDILDRVNRDIDGESPIALTPEATGQWRHVVEALQNSTDAKVRARAAIALESLSARARFLEEALKLQAAFSDLGVTSGNWQHYGEGNATWLIRTVERAGSKPLVVVVRAADIFGGVEADHADARITVGGAGKPLDTNILPGVSVNLQKSAVGKSERPSLVRLVFGLSLVLVMGMTFVAGYFVWRDTQREIRVSEMRSQFVSSVSHELKTPLTSIRMFAELLQMRSADAKTQAEYLDTIVNESERLTRLLNNVLDFSRIEHGQKTYRLEPTPLDEVVNSATRIMEYPLTELGFDLRVNIDREVPPVDADRDALKQAILNLLTNAMKYSGKSRAIELRVIPHNGDAVIQVSDHGIGIPAKEQARIFEKFYRANVPENHAISGTGLGLALVAHIAIAHNGSIHVESSLGEGSTFSIRLPLRTGRAS